MSIRPGANMGKPNIVNAPKNVPPLKAPIPKASALGTHPARTGVPGAALPSKATMKLTPQQQQQIQKLPPPQQAHPVSGKPAVQPRAPG